MKLRLYITAAILCFLSALAIAAEPSVTTLEHEHQLLIKQLNDKSSQLQTITRQHGNARKKLRNLKSQISKLEQNQLKAELNIKKITMFSGNNGELDAKQEAELRQAKYEKRKEEVRLRQLKKQYKKDDQSLSAITVKKNRLQKAVASLENQRISMENQNAFQNALDEKARQERAAKAKVAKNAARQRWLEKERIRKSALTQKRAADKALAAKAKKPKKKEKTAAEIHAEMEKQAKDKFLATRLSPQDAAKQQQTLMNIDANLPPDLRAIIRAKHRSLSPNEQEPNLGYLAELQLQDGENQNQSLGYLHYLGNHQYMHTIILKQGYQQYVVGPYKYTKRIPAQFNLKKGLLIINATDPNYPLFELYPASQNEFDNFTF